MPKGESNWNQRSGSTVAEKLAFYSRPGLNGCVEWTAAKQESGHGVISLGGGLITRAHRAAWREVHGPIPDGMCVCHHCDNPPCINVDHMFLGTIADNHADMVAKGRHRRGERSHLAKLTEQQALSIIADNRPVHLVAKDHSVRANCIYRIKSGKRWPHLPRPPALRRHERAGEAVKALLRGRAA